MPIRSGAMQRPRGCRCGNTLRQRYDEVGLPCSSTMGSPSPTSTYAISLPRTRRRCLWYGNAAEIMLASPPFCHSRDGVSEASLERGGARDVVVGGALGVDPWCNRRASGTCLRDRRGRLVGG